MFWTSIKYHPDGSPIRTETFTRPDGPAENSRITFRTRKTLLVRMAKGSLPDERASDSVSDPI
jgi:hypothetical protein